MLRILAFQEEACIPGSEAGQQAKKRSEMTVGATGNIMQGKDDKRWW